MIDVTYAANKGNHFAGSGYDLNQVDPDVRLQLGQALNTPVPNPYAGLVPGGLGAATITRERSLMPFPYYSSVNVRNPRLGNYMSHQLQFNITKRMSERTAGQSRVHRRQEDQRLDARAGRLRTRSSRSPRTAIRTDSTTANSTSRSIPATSPSAPSSRRCMNCRSVPARNGTRAMDSCSASWAAGS